MAEQEALSVGDAVRLIAQPAYLKTADPMPMLRPADLVSGDETAQVVGLRSGSQVAVKFRRGTFLLDAAQLQRIDA